MRPVGALDMGGASTQITFVSSDSSQSSANLTLYGKHYTVYTHSFLCYGMKEAQRRFLAQLVKVTISEVALFLLNVSSARCKTHITRTKGINFQPFQVFSTRKMAMSFRSCRCEVDFTPLLNLSLECTFLAPSICALANQCTALGIYNWTKLRS